MTTLLNDLMYRILSVSESEATVATRGFQVTSPLAKSQIEKIGVKFLQGYHTALRNQDINVAASSESGKDLQFRGFMYEGYAMGAKLLELLSFGMRTGVHDLLRSTEGQKNIYTIHVGLGWALARVPVNVLDHIKRYDDTLRWLIVDGYGFHEAYFKTRKYVIERKAPTRITDKFATHVFYQGVGRCLWFTEGADPLRIHERISSFHPELHKDLWSGVGLACTYAGGVHPAQISLLKSLSEKFSMHLAQGAAFAAKARWRAGTTTQQTEIACREICGCRVEDAARVCDDALQQLPEGLPSAQKYDSWRSSIRQLLTKRMEYEKS